MACGLAMMIMSRSLILSLESTRDTYYERYRFADVFCDLKRAPNALRTRLAEIPGWQRSKRASLGMTLDLPGLHEPADGTFFPSRRTPAAAQSPLPAHRATAGIGSHNEVVVGEAFAEAHGFNPATKSTRPSTARVSA